MTEGTEAGSSRDPVQEVRRGLGRLHELLDLLPGLLDECELVRAEAREARAECERLRQELSVIRLDHEEARRAQEELAGTVSTFVRELTRLMTEMIQKLRLRA